MDRDFQIRLAAMQHLEALKHQGSGLVTSKQMDEGFVFEGERIPLWNRRRGIWRPRQLGSDAAALSIFTAPHVAGKKPAYDDEIAADDRGWFGYKYEKDNPNTWTNVALRRALELNRPMIYLYGVMPNLYEPIFPVYVSGEDPASLTFFIQADAPFSAKQPGLEPASAAAPRREYQTVAVKRRLHQHRFRELVLGAYGSRCTMCRLGHTLLLDAAHIIPDRDDRGLPEVPNGLALCKIHHTAFDAHIIGIAPDLRVHVREDILTEIDGPMLEYGLKRMHGTKIQVPRTADLRPNPDYLADRFLRFRAA